MKKHISKHITHILRKVIAPISYFLSRVTSYFPSRWLKRTRLRNKLYYYTLIFGVFLVGIPIVLWQLSNPTRSDAAWFNDSWLYRQSVAVTNSSGSELTDYQVVITVDTSTLISDGKMQSGCDDIRVTNQAGKLLPYWIETGENGCNTATTNIWLKAGKLPTSGSTLLLYYGNPSAQNAENGNRVFEFFDDFSSNTLSQKWTGDTGNFTVSGGVLTGTNTSYRIQSQREFTGDYEFITRTDSTSTGSNVNGFMIGGFYESASNGYGVLNHSNTTNWYTRNDGSWNFQGTFTMGQWLRAEVKVVGTSGTATITGEDASTDTANNTNSGIAGEFVTLGTRYDNNSTNQTYDADWDWILVKKAVTTEPSISFGSEEQSPGPIAYWQLDEGSGTVANDSTQNNNHGSISGTTWLDSSMCVINKCLSFDGNDYISVSHKQSLNITNELTISLWVKPTSFTTTPGDADAWVSKRSGSSSSPFHFASSASSDGGETAGIYFRAYTSDDTIINHQGGTVERNKWQHVAVVFSDSDNYVKIYKNGVEVYSGTENNTPGTNTTDLVLGRLGSGSSFFFSGSMDDVMIYPYAKTAQQIQTEVNSGSGAVLGANDNSNLSNGLVGYWKMDDNVSGDAQTITDASGNGNNGTTDNGANATGMDCTTNGKFGTGCTLDGTDDYITRADTDILDISTGSMTWSSWFNTSSTARNMIYRKSGTSNADGVLMDIGSSVAGQARCLVSGPSASPNVSVTSTASTWNDGAWHFITCVLDRNAGTLTLYLDGIQQSSSDASGLGSSDLNASNSVLFGQGGTNTYFNGTLDEFRIYNRALSPAEVSQLYNFAPPPIYYAPLDEGDGTSVSDFSGSGYSGTINNTPTWQNGKYGKGIQFDQGTTQQVVSTASSGSLTYLNDHTLGFWVKFTDVADGAFRRVVGYKVTGVNDRAPGVWTCPSSSSTLGLHWKIGPSNLGFGCNGPTGASSVFELNKWHYLTATKDGTTLTYYVDGIQYGTATVDATMSSGTGTLYFGNDGTYRAAGMLLDEVRIYNYARTPGQIIEDMNAGHPLGGSPIGSQVGYWMFNEGQGTTVNNSGNGGPSISGSISGATWSNSGKIDKALSFDGTDDYVQIDDNSSLDIGTGNVTLTAWINTPQDWGSPLYRTIYTKATTIQYGNTNTNGYGLLVGNNGELTFVLSGSNPSGYLGGTDTVVPANTWTHVAAVYDASAQTVAYYINGKNYVTRTGVSAGDQDNTNPVIIGGVGRDYTGRIDEVKMYNAALTPEQIQIDYNQNQSLQFGVLGTEADGTPSNSSNRSYCPPGDTTATCGPIAEWLFEEAQGTTANDTSGNGNSGTLTGGATWTNGKVGGAIEFDGVDSMVSLSDSTKADIDSPLSVEAWIYPKTVDGNQLIVDKEPGGTGGTEDGYQFNLQNDDLLLWYGDGTSQELLNGSNIMTSNEWQHVAFVLDGTDAVLYRNGKEVTRESQIGTSAISNSDTLEIGQHSCSGCQFPFNGYIDTVRVYDYGLSAAQIAWNYNRGKPVAYYDFDECQGSTVHSFTEPYDPGLDGTINIGGSGSQASVGTCQTAGTAWGNGVSGKRNYSLNFDGTDDYVDLGDHSSISDFTSNFSIGVWVYPTSAGGVIYRGGQSTSPWNHLLQIQSTSQFRVRLWETPGTGGGDGTSFTVTGQSLFNTWSHLLYTYDGSTVKIYVNGVLESETAYSATIASGESTWIGQYPSGGTQYLTGKVDDVQIFNFALTDEQVRNFYNNGGVYFGP